jgi:hypothetical protein
LQRHEPPRSRAVPGAVPRRKPALSCTSRLLIGYPIHKKCDKQNGRHCTESLTMAARLPRILIVTIQITTTHDIHLNGRLSHFLLTRASERKRFYFHLPYERKSFNTQEKQIRRLNKLCPENTNISRPLHALLNGSQAAAACLSGAVIARGCDGANAALLLIAPSRQVPACCESLRRDR